MKIRNLALAGVAALALTGSAAASNATGWYVGLGGGWSNMAKVKINLTGTTTGKVAADPKNSPVFLGDVGYRFANRIRLAGEFSYAHYGFKGDTLDGHDNIAGMMVNALYDVPLSEKWDFTFGLGLGAGRTGFNVHTAAADIARGSETDFMWQGIVGVAYSITDRLDAYVDYRYRSVLSGGARYKTGYAGTTADGDNMNGSLIMAGLRFYFSGPETAAPPPPPPVMAAPPPPAPAAAPPPPPPAAVPQPVKTFVVFFDFNKSELTEKGQEVVAEAVDTAKANGFVKIKVIGHTDTVGKNKYNQRLSKARAASIKAEMVRLGLSADGITVEGKGFSDLLVKTGPSVNEPQNRRGEIDLDK